MGQNEQTPTILIGTEEEPHIYLGTGVNFTDLDKKNVDDNTKARHTHNNKELLDDITQENIDNWNNKSNNNGDSYTKEETDTKLNKLKESLDVPILQAMYNEVLEPSPEKWFIFDESGKMITDLNTEYESEYSVITDLVFPFQINGVTVEIIGNSPNSINLPSNIKNVRLPNCVKQLGDCAFYYKTNIVTINIPTSCEYIGIEAFSSCTSLENVITPIKPNYELHIGDSAFKNCSALNNIDTIIDGIKSISYQSFDACVGLEHIIIPESTDLITFEAFNGCTNLKTVTILNSKCEFDESYGSIFPENSDLIIKGYKGSTAEIYAYEKGFIFIALDDVYAKADEVIPTPTTANIGQTIVVKEVDESGKPTKWETADIGGGATEETLELLYEGETTEEVKTISVTTDTNGNTFELEELYVEVIMPKPSTQLATYIYFADGISCYTTTSVNDNTTLLVSWNRNYPYAKVDNYAYYSNFKTSAIKKVTEDIVVNLFRMKVFDGVFPIGTKLRVWGKKV